MTGRECHGESGGDVGGQHYLDITVLAGRGQEGAVTCSTSLLSPSPSAGQTVELDHASLHLLQTFVENLQISIVILL